MFTIVVIVVPVCVLVYVLRRNFRRAWYVLRTGDEHPDWDKLGADYFVAPWEKRRMNRAPQKNDNPQTISE